MIYTIGHKESYEQAFKEHDTVIKMGRHDDYDGGSVWKDKESASMFANKGFVVYGVLAEWGVHTEPSKSGASWHDLLIDAKIVKLD